MKTKVLMIALAVILFSNAQAQVPSYVPTNGLVGWWPFNGNANDESGNGNNGVVNGPTLTADRFGVANKAYNFDGVNDYVNCGNVASINSVGQLTISGWIKYNSIINSSRIVGKEQVNNGVDGIEFCLDNYQGNNNALKAGIRNGVSSYGNTGQVLSPGVYYFVTMVFNGGGASNNDKLKIYINGNVQSITYNAVLPLLTPNNNYDLWIGGNPPISTDAPFDGQIDDIGIWNRALTQQEITNLYNSSAYVPCASPAFPSNLANGLVGYWPFCGDANDESGNGNNGTVNGATLTSDRFGNPNSAYEFDGVSNYIYIPYSNSLNINGTISISCWFKNTNISNSNNGVLVFHGDNQGGKDPFTLNYSGLTNEVYFAKYVGAGTTPANVREARVSAPFNSNWNHYLMSFDSTNGQANFYLNGSLILDTVFSNTLISYNTSLPSFFTSFGGLGALGQFSNSFLDDIGIWNRALTASEVQQLYNTGIYFQTVTGSCDTLQFNANITGFNPVTYQNQVKVFPNPAKDNLVIDCGANYNTLNGYSIKIVNTLSQTVYNSPITQQITNIQLIAPTWSNGAYVVQFINPSGTVIEAKQIIIQ